MNKLPLAGIFLKTKFCLISIMVSTSRKKALKSVSISPNKVSFLVFFLASRTPSSESYFPSSGNVFLNESSNPYGGDAFSVLWKPFSLI